MADWHPGFHHPVSLTLATCEHVLNSVVDAPVGVQIGGLDVLSEIDLGAAPGGREPGGISDAAARELALSPRLPALTQVARSIEHHVYADGAREGTDEVEVRRDDGRVVRSVIDHVVWP